MLKICAALVEVTRTNSLGVSRPLLTPRVPDHRHAVFDAGAAVRDLREVVGAHRLLLVAERAVVGRRGVQMARLQAGPQRVLVVLRAKRRAHHVGRGDAPVGVAVDRVVDRQVPGEHLAEHALPAGARAHDGLQRFLVRDVHDVDRAADHLGEADRAVRRLGLDRRSGATPGAARARRAPSRRACSAAGRRARRSRRARSAAHRARARA